MHSDIPIPAIQIDLAARPEDRYYEVAREFGRRMRELQPLLDELLEASVQNNKLRSLVKLVLSLTLRRMSTRDETRELKGLAKQTGVKLHLLIALNVLLDAMMGCTSGAVAVKADKGVRSDRQNEETKPTERISRREGLRRRKETGQAPIEMADRERPPRDIRLMHFRTLDWGMDKLRDLIVVLEYIDSKSNHPTRVIARSVTYAGYTGILTGVRRGFSASLNFRPTSMCKDGHLWRHKLAVLLGIRPSVGSLLRSVVLPESLTDPRPSFSLFRRQPNADTTKASKVGVHDFPFALRIHGLTELLSTSCFLTLCDGIEVAIVEKDFNFGTITHKMDWACITNHDLLSNTDPSASTTVNSRRLAPEPWLLESESRLRALQDKWHKSCFHKRPVSDGLGKGTLEEVAIEERELRKWVNDYPTMNECTHFGCIMDPGTGELRWLQRGLLQYEPSSIGDEDDGEEARLSR